VAGSGRPYVPRLWAYLSRRSLLRDQKRPRAHFSPLRLPRSTRHGDRSC
jgi:hypothetical protein